jgi:hypothetical protein
MCSLLGRHHASLILDLNAIFLSSFNSPTQRLPVLPACSRANCFHCSVQQVLQHPTLLRLLGVPLAGTPPLTDLVDSFMPHAQQLLADSSPHVRRNCVHV